MFKYYIIDGLLAVVVLLIECLLFALTLLAVLCFEMYASDFDCWAFIHCAFVHCCLSSHLDWWSALSLSAVSIYSVGLSSVFCFCPTWHDPQCLSVVWELFVWIWYLVKSGSNAWKSWNGLELILSCNNYWDCNHINKKLHIGPSWKLRYHKRRHSRLEIKYGYNNRNNIWLSEQFLFGECESAGKSTWKWKYYVLESIWSPFASRVMDLDKTVLIRMHVACLWDFRASYMLLYMMS